MTSTVPSPLSQSQERAGSDQTWPQIEGQGRKPPWGVRVWTGRVPPCARREGASPAAGMACPSSTQEGAGYGEGTGCDQGIEGRARSQLAAAGALGPTAGVASRRQYLGVSWPRRRHDSSNALTGPLDDFARRALKRLERSTRRCPRRLRPRRLLSLRPPPAPFSAPARAFS